MATTTDDDLEGPPGDKKMPLLDHLIELRQRLIWSALAFFVAFIVCYVFHKQIFTILVAPMNTLPTRIQSRAGAQPNATPARIGPTIGPAAAIAEKCWPSSSCGGIGS